MTPVNLLPYDGEVYYFGKILSETQEREYFQSLMKEVPWKRDEVFIYGKMITTKRKVAWFSDSNKPYEYSHTTKIPVPWFDTILELKSLAENYSDSIFNSCLANLYSNGEEGMSWHSDDESSLERQAAIASFSLGAERRFDFKHKSTKEKLSLVLEPGSLLVMKGLTQERWQHSLPITKKIKTPRINLTFRKML